MAAAALAIGSVSCSKPYEVDNSSDDTKERSFSESELKNTHDSLAYYLGAQQGAYYNRAFSELTDEQKEQMNLTSGIDKDAFYRGLKTALEADTANGSYLLGIQEGLNLSRMIVLYHQNGVDINREMLASILKDNLNKDLDELTDSEFERYQMAVNQASQIVQEHVLKVQEQRRQEQEKINDVKYRENIKAGRKFMSELQDKYKDIVITPSGLAYKVIRQGHGSSATMDDRVNVIYTGKLIDGTEFDSSKGEAVTFLPTAVVPGFAEALTIMPPGSKYTLYIPAELAYDNNELPNIPPGSTLIFDVEVVDIERSINN